MRAGSGVGTSRRVTHSSLGNRRFRDRRYSLQRNPLINDRPVIDRIVVDYCGVLINIFDFGGWQPALAEIAVSKILHRNKREVFGPQAEVEGRAHGGAVEMPPRARIEYGVRRQRGPAATIPGTAADNPGR